ncbi:hypothetical protein D9758_003413 [Tetrapyrgos nigripes]|uniref:NADH:flavin oxidoreductase/NADH oxidase N-terminal domain-containing protein n=1 Tax=Tetrapyrgos nigripes TaxID=182062 RepID=A0A8H5GUZ3_9AGAR|nr:hypothetical protein D9758_003413 [Tetrapyrgos nigripes]
MSSSNFNKELSVLFTPMKLGPLTLRNKFFIAALTRDRNVGVGSPASATNTNVPTDVTTEHYRQRAKGGASLIVTEALQVTQHGAPWPYAGGIWSEAQVQGWKKVTDAVHEEGAYIYAQIWHPGRVAQLDTPGQNASGELVYAPSAIQVRPGGINRFRYREEEPWPSMPVEIKDPKKFIEQHRQAALKAKEAGFDGVEIHAGGGFLIHEFLDKTLNKRTDEWGGSVENRAKFALEVFKAVAGVFGPDRVGVKIQPTGGYNDVGMPLEDTVETFGYLLTEADKLGLAYFQVLRYHKSTDEFRDGKGVGLNHDTIKIYKPFLKKTYLFGNQSYTPSEAAEHINSGKVDGVFFGLPWIANPDFAKRVEYGIPLNEKVDISRLYHPQELTAEELRKGYTDYPFAELPLAN